VKISSKFTPRVVPNPSKNNKETAKHIPVTIKKTPPLPPLPAKSKKEVNVISKYFQNNKTSMDPKKQNRSYAQASKQTMNTSKVFKIKKSFPALNVKEIDQVNNIIKGNLKPKPHIQMTMKELSRKQIIVPMSIDNNNSFMKNLVTHVVNINKFLRNAKSEVLVDYIHSDPLRISIITNKVSLQSDLQIINQYMKNSEDINALQVDEPQLPQSKSYLKIIGIPYYPYGKSQDCLTSSNVETILKQNQIFDNIKLASKLRVIKVSPKLNMSIIWIDIWDIQSDSKAKGLINQCFNISKYIATVRGANMNPDVPQCKNCWKCGHVTFSCRIQGSKCIKCNSPHKLENYHKFRWCCKANKKTNLP